MVEQFFFIVAYDIFLCASFMRVKIIYTPLSTQHLLVNFGPRCLCSTFRFKFNCIMRDNKHARVLSSGIVHIFAEQTLRRFLCEAGHTSIYSIKSQGWQVYF